MKKLLLIALLAVVSLTVNAQDKYKVYKAEYNRYNATTEEWDLVKTNYPEDMNITVSGDYIYVDANNPLNIKIYSTGEKEYKTNYVSISSEGYITTMNVRCTVTTAKFTSTNKLVIYVFFDDSNGNYSSLSYFLN